MEQTLDQLVIAARRAIPDLNEARLREAYAFADAAHAGQLRMSGDPYITHPLAAAFELANLNVDEDTLVACLLHDVPEDTPRTCAEIRAAFGDGVGDLIDGVTKLSKVQYKNEMEQHQVENLRKMFLVMAEDIRVVLIKLADRLHNMQTLRWVRPEKRVRIARETLEIYAPLADRLGIWQFKWQLEDLCFRHLYPLEEAALRETVSEGQAEREALIERVRAMLERELKAAGIPTVDISGRTKHLYSIFRKMELKGKALDEIYDLFALRILVPTVKDCYAVLGVVHDLWKPKPGRFKDYIAVPKPNGYQSLHTTVFCIGGRLTEFQIRTFAMHQEAEFGVSAHWHYSASKGTRMQKPKREWLQSIVELQEAATDSREFIESVKLDVFNDRIFVFTPKGDVKDLSKGATALDFAYSIHTDVGHRTVGVKVNGSIATLGTKLATGDVIEVITSKTPAPKRDWMALVQSQQARTKIRGWFRGQNRGKNIEVGRALLNKMLEQAGKEKIDKMSDARIRPALDAFNVKTETELLAGLGDGTYSAFQVLKRLYRPDELLTEVTPKKQASASGAGRPRIMIQGAGDLEVNVAKCCNPQPVEKIVGFVTKSKVITVHKPDCGSVKHLDPERLIHASWETTTDQRRYETAVRVAAADRPTLTRDILLALSQVDVRVLRLETMQRKNGETALLLAVEVGSLDALARLYDVLLRIPGVTDVSRA